MGTSSRLPDSLSIATYGQINTVILEWRVIGCLLLDYKHHAQELAPEQLMACHSYSRMVTGAQWTLKNVYSKSLPLSILVKFGVPSAPVCHLWSVPIAAIVRTPIPILHLLWLVPQQTPQYQVLVPKLTYLLRKLLPVSACPSSYFSCCDNTPDISNLRKGGFILAHGSRVILNRVRLTIKVGYHMYILLFTGQWILLNDCLTFWSPFRARSGSYE